MSKTEKSKIPSPDRVRALVSKLREESSADVALVVALFEQDDAIAMTSAVVAMSDVECDAPRIDSDQAAALVTGVLITLTRTLAGPENLRASLAGKTACLLGSVRRITQSDPKVGMAVSACLGAEVLIELSCRACVGEFVGDLGVAGKVMAGDLSDLFSRQPGGAPGGMVH